MNDFFITLPSNSSAQYYPDNQASRYRTQLAQSIQLEQQWEVAVYECRFPITWKNVLEDHNTFTFQTTEDDETPLTISIPTGYYNTLGKLIAVINERTPTKRKPAIKVVNSSHFVVLHGYYRFEEILGHILGVSLNHLLGPRERNQYSFDADALHHSIYLYGDFIHPQVVGDSMSPLLARIGVDNAQHGEYKTYSPRHLSYLPVIGEHLHSPLIYLCDETGRKIDFQTGIISVLLHFRQRL